MAFLFPDISEWQENADIEGILDQSNGHLIIRAGYGPDRKDFMFDEFRDRASDAKTLGIYHFVTKDGSVADNANAFINWIGDHRSNEYYVLDVEPGSGDWSRSECEDYMSRIRDALGGKVLIYANEHYASTGGRRPLFTSEQGWVAKFSDAEPSIPHLIWQASGTIDGEGVGSHITDWPGVGTNGDTNRVEVSESRFMELVLGSDPGSGDNGDDDDADDGNFMGSSKLFWYSMDYSEPFEVNKDSRYCIPWHNSSNDSVTNAASVMYNDQNYVVAAHINVTNSGSGEGRYLLEFGKVREGNTSWDAEPYAVLTSVTSKGDGWEQIACFDRNSGDERLRLWITPLDNEATVTHAKLVGWHTERG